MTLDLGFSILAVVAAALSVAFSDMRKVILFAWVASMSVGALFLDFGAEYLAIVQWIVGTLVCISLFLSATMFGEYGQVEQRSVKERLFDALPAALVGVGLFATTALAIHGFSAPGSVSGPDAGVDLVAVGQSLTQEHAISLELIGLTLLVVLIGAGAISRQEGK